MLLDGILSRPQLKIAKIFALKTLTRHSYFKSSGDPSSSMLLIPILKPIK